MCEKARNSSGTPDGWYSLSGKAAPEPAGASWFLGCAAVPGPYMGGPPRTFWARATSWGLAGRTEYQPRWFITFQICLWWS